MLKETITLINFKVDQNKLYLSIYGILHVPNFITNLLKQHYWYTQMQTHTHTHQAHLFKFTNLRRSIMYYAHAVQVNLSQQSEARQTRANSF